MVHDCFIENVASAVVADTHRRTTLQQHLHDLAMSVPRGMVHRSVLCQNIYLCHISELLAAFSRRFQTLGFAYAVLFLETRISSTPHQAVQNFHVSVLRRIKEWSVIVTIPGTKTRNWDAFRES